MQFSSMKLIGIKGVHDHIMHIWDIVAQLNGLEVTMSKSFLYAPFKISYNTHKEKWSINELLIICIQEKERFIMEEGEKVNLTTYEKNKNQAKNKDKIYDESIIKKKSKCFYLLRYKDEALDAFKVFMVEVKKQYRKQIKIVKSSSGGEYYGTYIENGQALGPFAKFLQEHEIVA
ncbi:hypothetical protein CR513_47053, partial [Mucuna pruriens]